MKNKLLIITIIVTNILLFSCDGGPKGQGEDPAVEHLLTEFESGQIYYETNCADCHSAGSYDSTSAFGASDLTLPDKKLKIVSNMTKSNSNANNYGGEQNLMERFKNIPYDRYHQLRRYLDNIK